MFLQVFVQRRRIRESRVYSASRFRKELSHEVDFADAELLQQFHDPGVFGFRVFSQLAHVSEHDRFGLFRGSFAKLASAARILDGLAL